MSQAEQLSAALKHVPFAKPLAGRSRDHLALRRPHRSVSRPSALHTGVDLSEDTGTEVRATAPGRVTVAGPVSGYGTMVEIDHGAGPDHALRSPLGDGCLGRPDRRAGRGDRPRRRDRPRHRPAPPLRNADRRRAGRSDAFHGRRAATAGRHDARFKALSTVTCRRQQARGWIDSLGSHYRVRTLTDAENATVPPAWPISAQPSDRRGGGQHACAPEIVIDAAALVSLALAGCATMERIALHGRRSRSRRNPRHGDVRFSGDAPASVFERLRNEVVRAAQARHEPVTYLALSGGGGDGAYGAGFLKGLAETDAGRSSPSCPGSAPAPYGAVRLPGPGLRPGSAATSTPAAMRRRSSRTSIS